MARKYSLRAIIIFSVLLLVVVLGVITGGIWYLREKSYRYKAVVEELRTTLEPIAVIGEQAIAAGNYYIMQNEDYKRIFKINPNLLFFQYLGTTDTGEPYEFSFSPPKGIGEYSKYPKLYKILPTDSPERRRKKEERNRKIMERVNAYLEEVKPYLKIPEEFKNKDIYYDKEKNWLYLRIKTRNKNGGEVWGILKAEELEHITMDILKTVGGTIFFVIVVMVAVTVFLSKHFTKSLVTLAEEVKRLGDTLDLRREVKVRSSIKEVELISEAVSTFVEKVKELLKGVSQEIQSLSQVAQRLFTSAQELKAVSGAAKEKVHKITEETQGAKGDIAQIVNSLETISQAVREISEQTQATTTIVNEAAEESAKAQENSERLLGYSQEINDIVKFILQVAEQTNLLALNATIEAARAGEAGKSFAVVANEVKELARQIQDSVENIRKSVQNIQDGISNNSEQIAKLMQAMKELSEKSQIVLGTVEQQSATTQEIFQEAQEVIQSIEEVLTKNTEIETNINAIDEEEDKLIHMVNEIKTIAENLKNLSKSFKV